MDHVANALGKDPTEVRKVNMSAEGDEVHVGDGRLLGAGALAECFELCEEKYGERRAEVDRFNAASKERFTRDDCKILGLWTPLFSMPYCEIGTDSLIHILCLPPPHFRNIRRDSSIRGSRGDCRSSQSSSRRPWESSR